MTLDILHLRGAAGAPAATLLVGTVLLIGAGCSFESGLESAACDEEERRFAGNVCRGNFWVPADSSPRDASDTSTGRETSPPTDATSDDTPQGNEETGPSGSDAIEDARRRDTDAVAVDTSSDLGDTPSDGTGDADPDGDGRICVPERGAPTSSVCSDGIDNDCDDSVDTDDFECLGTAGEICNNDEDCLGQCEGGRCAQTIFVTSETWEGDLGGLAGADAKCNDVAESAGLGGDWKAILSASPNDNDTPVASRIRGTGTHIYNTRGDRLADSVDDLWDGGSLDSPIRFDERRSRHKTRVWTGSGGDGGADRFECYDWTSSDGGLTRGQDGFSTTKGSSWLEYNDPESCDSELALYCIDGQN